MNSVAMSDSVGTVRVRHSKHAPDASSILLYSAVFPPGVGGSGRWFAELYPRLRTIRPTVLTVEHNDAGAVDRSLQLEVLRADVGMHDRTVGGVAGLRRYLSTASKVDAVLRRCQCGALHAARPLHEGLVARVLWQRRGIPYTCYVHGEDISVARGSRELRFLTNRVFSGAERLIANSSYTESLLREDWPTSRGKVVRFHPGVDTTHYAPSPQRSRLRHARGWDGKTVLLTVGRLQERKGQDTGIRATSRLLKQHPGLVYAIVGNGPCQDRLRRLASELGCQDAVQFLGELPDEELRSAYQAADIFMLPNRAVGGDVEGFGIVLLEAQACGLPVIAGDSGGTVDTLQAGVTGMLVDCSEDSDQLSAVLNNWITNVDHRIKTGEAARRWVAERFDWSRLAARADEEFNPACEAQA